MDRQDAARSSGAAPSRPGSAAEDALDVALLQAGCEVLTFADWMHTVEIGATWDGSFVKEYRWGLRLTPSRGFRSDLAVPDRALLIEIEGQVHSIKGQRKSDVRRDQLAQAAGYRIVRVLPEQVTKDNGAEALRVIRAALAPKESA